MLVPFAVATTVPLAPAVLVDACKDSNIDELPGLKVPMPVVCDQLKAVPDIWFPKLSKAEAANSWVAFGTSVIDGGFTLTCAKLPCTTAKELLMPVLPEPEALMYTLLIALYIVDENVWTPLSEPGTKL
jgi:hypothetical protein